MLLFFRFRRQPFNMVNYIEPERHNDLQHILACGLQFIPLYLRSLSKVRYPDSPTVPILSSNLI